MPKIELFNKQAQKVRDIELNHNVFGVEVNN